MPSASYNASAPAISVISQGSQPRKGGTVTGEGRLFAAVVREDDLPWEDGMHIDGGVVRG